LYRATKKLAKTQTTANLNKKVRTLGNTPSSSHKNPYDHDASRSELKNRNIQKFGGRYEEVEFTLEEYSLSELEDFMLSEDFEQLDELSKSTLGSYIKKSKSNIIMHGSTLGTDINKRVKDKSAATMQKRAKGINKAVDKLTEEELDEAEEKVKYVSGHGWGPGRVQVTTNKGRKIMVKHEINKDHSYSGPQVGHKMADWEHMKEEIEEGYDSSGAYEKHDPKHPAFVKNYTKFKTANPKGTIGDFVAHMKKQK